MPHSLYEGAHAAGVARLRTLTLVRYESSLKYNEQSVPAIHSLGVCRKTPARKSQRAGDIRGIRKELFR